VARIDVQDMQDKVPIKLDAGAAASRNSQKPDPVSSRINVWHDHAYPEISLNILKYPSINIHVYPDIYP
jgi:hypothetical protein